ncbi:HlyD family secretion protein [Rhodopirellula sp. P2]|uniref:HlyD family secretion protein n=1 Tax=Rhodopirellula sp. P2 TaxID=2127060 RepID=UPI0023675922|nr:HlyD family efflux transporter periplasmic adaptor subunit [Rhodopirellula sp. P2]WDQ16183.1 HlyD family efflux transporter periplasmic adaptor subunit [Rhodopirellula sp. P2]
MSLVNNNESTPTMTDEETSAEAKASPDSTTSAPTKTNPPRSPYESGIEVDSPRSDDNVVQLVDSSNAMQWALFNIGAPLLLLAAAGGLVYALGSVQPSTRPPADNTLAGRLQALPAVDVVPIQSLADSGQILHLNTDGTVVPFREVILATEVAGRIIEKSPQCEAGQYVTAGTVLMRIDPTDYELTVRRLEQTQQSEYEAINEVDQELINAARLLEIADADIELQSREAKRLDSLPEDFAARRDVDAARRGVLQAEQQKVTVQNQIDLLKKRRTRLELAEQLAATQLKQANIDLQRTEIRAPIDGVIASEQAELNTFVARGNPVVTMEDTSKVEVATSLRTDQLYWVLNQKTTQSPIEELNAPANGAHRGYKLPPTEVKVQYQLSGRDDVTYVWDGQLTGYDGIGLDEQTRTVPVRVVVDQPQMFEIQRRMDDGSLAPTTSENVVSTGPTALVRGMFVRLQLQLHPAVPLVILPSEALKPGNRVWEFIPDESVLDVPEIDNQTAAAEGSDSKATAAAVADSEMTADDRVAKTDAGESENLVADSELAFVPENWTAGRLVIRHDIRPIDLLSAVGGSSDLWICEVPDQSVTGDSFVVVSPLGSIEADTFPVRAPKKNLVPPNDPKPDSLLTEAITDL